MITDYSKINSIRQFPFIDTLYDYGKFLAHSDIFGRIGHISPNQEGSRVAIIGAGLSGLVAARELLLAGVEHVTLFEAEAERAGGRLLSQKFDSDIPQYIAEMGAMRFPPTEVGLFHYLDKYNIDSVSVFPDPGIVDTEIHYQGKSLFWKADGNPPELFARVDRGWKAFLSDGVVLDNDVALTGPMQITKFLHEGRLMEAREAWQKYLDIFGDSCFYSALVRIFSCRRSPGGTQWEKPDDFQLFGSLGIGSGGFQPVFRASFIEILRLVVNGLEDDQRLIPSGISTLTERMLEECIQGDRIGDRISYRKVTRILRKNDGKYSVTLIDGLSEVFDRVIVTASSRAMQVSLNLNLPHTRELLSPKVIRAVNETHIIGSSKLFLLTRDKFWLKNQLPHTILTDSLAKGVYCLDYTPDDPDGHGVVLISYTWEDDSHKLVTLKDKSARLKRLVEEIAHTAPEFASHLIPMDNDPKYILEYDWLMDPNALGAFKLNYPGDDRYSEELFYQFQSARQKESDQGIYLAGCSCSFNGGWAEGAVQTGINAACAVIFSLGGELLSGNPLDTLSRHYQY